MALLLETGINSSATPDKIRDTRIWKIVRRIKD